MDQIFKPMNDPRLRNWFLTPARLKCCTILVKIRAFWSNIMFEIHIYRTLTYSLGREWVNLSLITIVYKSVGSPNSCVGARVEFVFLVPHGGFQSAEDPTSLCHWKFRTPAWNFLCSYLLAIIDCNKYIFCFKSSMYQKIFPGQFHKCGVQHFIINLVVKFKEVRLAHREHCSWNEWMYGMWYWWQIGGYFLQEQGAFQKLLNLRALKFSLVNKIHSFQWMGKIFCVEFQRVPLKFHAK